MSKITETAKQLLDNLSVLPGYTDQEGVLEIRIRQASGGVRGVDIRFVREQKMDLNGCSIGSVLWERVTI